MKSNNLFWWNTSKTDKAISSALKILSKRYPALTGKKGEGKELRFVKGENNICSVENFNDGFVITYGSNNMALRMVGNIIAGAIPKAQEKSPFTTLGIMLDCSRNAVKTVPFIKKYLDHLAILGYNMIMIYTEDTYQLDDEPMFGFMRGAYTQKEIREIDDYAAALGIEMIPCIEALGHMEQIFKWGYYSDIRDRDGILLVDEEKTYTLIGKMLDFWSGAVRSRRIHLGMDEAHGLGTGQHEKIHGKESAFDIINRHLKRCCAMCGERGLKPMIWSDMYFRIGSKTNSYYDLQSQPPQEVIDDVPEGLELVYWDYYNNKSDFYGKMIEKHRDIAGDPLMGSGVWTWSSLWYNHFVTRKTVIPCLEACREKGLKEVFFTMWGDDGGYCDYGSALAGLAFSAELSFTGKADEDRLVKLVKGLFNGASYKAITAFGDLQNYDMTKFILDDPIMLLYIRSYFNYNEKWGDQGDSMDFFEFKAALEAAEKIVAKAPANDGAGNMRLAKALSKALVIKFNYAVEVFKASKLKNHRPVAKNLLKFAKEYEKYLIAFYNEFEKNWHEHNKPFGLESIQIRLGGQLVRARELVVRLQEFNKSDDKTIPEIAELGRAGSTVMLNRRTPYLGLVKGSCNW